MNTRNLMHSANGICTKIIKNEIMQQTPKNMLQYNTIYTQHYDSPSSFSFCKKRKKILKNTLILELFISFQTKKNCLISMYMHFPKNRMTSNEMKLLQNCLKQKKIINSRLQNQVQKSFVWKQWVLHMNNGLFNFNFFIVFAYSFS